MSFSETDKRDDWYVAIHEAAHAVVGQLLGSPVETATIEPDPDAGSGGHAITWHGDPYSDLGGESWNLLVRAVTCYAGHAATRKLGYDEEFEDAGADQDYRSAAIALDGDVSLQKRAIAMAELIVESTWSQIELVVEVLETERTVSGEKIVGVMKL